MQQLALTEKNQITKIGLKIVKSQEIMNEILLKIKRAQQEFDKQIYLKSGVEWKWNSIINIERLKLCLLVEVGEFANELKTFKIWHKKQDLQLDKANEELIDCLGFFVGLSLVKKVAIEKFEFEFSDHYSKKINNNLFLKLFLETMNLPIEETDEEILYLAYHKWWEVFCEIIASLNLPPEKLLKIYEEKLLINKQRVLRGGH